MQNEKNGHYDLEQTRNNLPDNLEPPTGVALTLKNFQKKRFFIETRIINFRNYRNFKRLI